MKKERGVREESATGSLVPLHIPAAYLTSTRRAASRMLLSADFRFDASDLWYGAGAKQG